MQTPTTVKNLITSSGFEKTYDKVEELVKDKPMSSLALSVAAGAAIGFFLPASRLLKLGVTLYPLYQAYLAARETEVAKDIVKH